MPETRVRIGLDVGGTKIEAVAVDERGAILARVRRATGWGADPVVESILAAADELGRAGSFSVPEIASVGVGIPGIVEAHSGRVLHAVNLGIASLDLASRLTEALGAEVRIANDVKAATMGAAALRGRSESMAYLNLGTGVSAGIVLGGRLWQGAFGTAGEVGHISVDPQGRLCGCGQRGCIETLCGGGTLAAAWGRGGAFPVSDIVDAAEAGDEQARQLRDDLVRGAAAAVRVLVLTADVETVVIGGGIAALGERLEDPLRAALRRDAASSGFLASLRIEQRIELLPEAAQAAAFGAALIGRDGLALPGEGVVLHG